MNQILSNDPDAVSHYIDFLDIQVLIKSTMSNLENDFSSPLCSDEIQGLEDLWHQLAQEEKSAPEIEITQEKPQRELIQKVVYSHRERPKVSRFNIVFLVMNAAAVLFLVLFIKFVPPKRGVDVAVLTDSFNAQWENVDDSMQTGTRLAANSTELYLKEGLAELLFDNNAKVIIEGPARFKLIADDRIGLSYGKAYTIVPQEAVGFSVYTRNAKVIDLGTEFGVEVNSQGDTYLSVVKGQTQLIAGKKPDVPTMVVGQKTAKIVNGSTCDVSSIPYNEYRFVRSFISANKAIWRGQSSLDLADMVRMGNGLGTGSSEVRLNYEKGFTTEIRWGHTSIFETYLPIEDTSFIDGIFIPNGKTTVSSRGDVFEGFPFTNGVYCADLIANPKPGAFVIDGQPRTIQFDGQEYSDFGKSCIVMQNSNHGITFDLDAIRSRYNLKIDRFESEVGLVDFDGKRCNANFYVLVDGQLRYSLPGYNQKGILNRVSVNLKDTDRFLTLATSENVDQIDYMANSTLHENWCVFAEPVLVLESGDQGL
ncbi:MAG: NPCBM/NEW2 domain-containing protein [Anaerohalosphaeraceae bacterium]